MAYRIEYFNRGKIIGARVLDVPLEDAQKAVTEDMAQLGADFVRLIDIDGSHAEVWSSKRETP